MADETERRTADAFPGIQRYVSLLAWAIPILVILVIPLKIIGYGYLPVYDDALPDAAKAVSGKPWQDILVLKSSYTMDHHIGWHTFLAWVHHLGHLNVEGLVLFSVVGLFVLVAWSALPWLKRPEAWLGTLILVAGVGSGTMGRFMLGRQLLISVAVLLTILFLWHRRADSQPGWKTGAAMAALIALAVLLHGIWYFWVLLIAAFFLARQFRWGFVLTGSWIVGTLVGSLLTGHPITYMVEAVQLALTVIGRHAVQRTLVSELRPTPGNLFPLLLLGALLVTRRLANLKARPLNTNPAFWLACLGWVLGYQADRFWEDWGLPALMVLLTTDLELLMQTHLAANSLKRLALTAGLAVTLFLSTTNDADSRWTFNLDTQYLSQDDPQLAGWLPDKDGIFYDVDMFFFYQTFFKNPHADWRYMVGFEPVLMPAKDFEIYDRILWNHRNPKAYQPWVDQMRPQDRLAMRGDSGAPSLLPQLEWKNADGYWLGRLPRGNSRLSAPTDTEPSLPR